MNAPKVHVIQIRSPATPRFGSRRCVACTAENLASGCPVLSPIVPIQSRRGLPRFIQSEEKCMPSEVMMRVLLLVGQISMMPTPC